MSGRNGPSRRAMLKVGLAATATVASPAILRLTAEAQSGPIKIGLPLALTGPLGTVGQQTKRGAELYAKLQNAKGGIAGRPIELLIEDTAGNPANCVRKAQEMVERHNCRLLTGTPWGEEERRDPRRARRRRNDRPTPGQMFEVAVNVRWETHKGERSVAATQLVRAAHVVREVAP